MSACVCVCVCMYVCVCLCMVGEHKFLIVLKNKLNFET